MFAWLTVLLAIVGLYALLASTVAERAREIGVRLALGAGTRRIVGLVLGDGVRIALCGIAAGMLTAFAGGRLMRALLFETSPFDAFALAAAPIALITVAIAACTIPGLSRGARRPGDHPADGVVERIRSADLQVRFTEECIVQNCQTSSPHANNS